MKYCPKMFNFLWKFMCQDKKKCLVVTNNICCKKVKLVTN